MFAVLFVAALIGQTQAAPASCWTKIAPRAQYSASDQIRDLQIRVKAGGCEVIGLAWTTTAAPSQESLLLWEAKPQTLWRLTMDRQGPRWEKWGGASRERILADNRPPMVSHWAPTARARGARRPRRPPEDS